MPESSIEILGHSVGGVTYRHYAHRDPLGVQSDHDATSAHRIQCAATTELKGNALAVAENSIKPDRCQLVQQTVRHLRVSCGGVTTEASERIGFELAGCVQPMSRMKSSNCVRCSMECGFAISTPWPAYSKLAPFSPFHEGEWCSPSWKGEKGWG